MPDIVKKPHKPYRIPRLFASPDITCQPLTDAFGSFEVVIFRYNEQQKFPNAVALGNFFVKLERKRAVQNR